MHSSPLSGPMAAGHDSPPLHFAPFPPQPLFLFHEKQSVFVAAACLKKFRVQMPLSVLCSLWLFQRKLLLILLVLSSE